MNFAAYGFLVVIYFMLYCSIFWFTLLYEKRKEVHIDPKAKSFPGVTIVIPVYRKDTKDAVRAAVESCMKLTYPDKKVIFAWNGPRNEVFDICKKFADKGIVKLVETEKKGKAAGMNAALKEIDTELFCCLDADSFFHPDSLQNMVGYFENPKVSSVTSSMKVANPRSWIEKVQWLEYIFAIYLRRLMSLIDCVFVIPGPGSMYKTAIVRDVGGFSEKSMVEDMEIGFRMQSKGYLIKNSIHAMVDTIAPSNFKDLYNQRLRWYGGFWETLKDYKYMVLNPKYGALGMFMIPNAIIWILIIIITALKFGFDFFTSAAYQIKSLLIIGFDWQLFVKNFMRLFSFQPTYMTIFGLFLVGMAIVTIAIGLKLSKEKFAFKTRYQHYFIYFIAYTSLLSIFWLAALGYILTKRKVAWGS